MIGIVGCGTIGTEIALAIDKQIIKTKLVSLYDIDKNKCILLKNKLQNQKPFIAKTLKELIKSVQLIFESANPKTVKEIAEICFPEHKDLFVMSVGGLIMYPEIFKLVKKYNCKIYYPSGAIAGLDGVSAAKFGKIKYIKLTTTKPLNSLKGSPGLKKYLAKSKKKLSRINKPTIIYEGNALTAISLFPQNINVSAALSLSGIGAKKTSVRIIAHPTFKKNIHEIEVFGNFGKIYTKTENIPSTSNPKTSYLAILSAISQLHKLFGF